MVGRLNERQKPPLGLVEDGHVGEPIDELRQSDGIDTPCQPAANRTPSPARGTLVPVPDTSNPYREDIAGFLRRAECHFGHTLNEEEAGLTVAESVIRCRVALPQVKRKPDIEQVTACREAVHRVLDGEIPTAKNAAKYDEAVYRALLHFRGEMSPDLQQYVLTLLSELQSTHGIKRSVMPLLRHQYPAWDPTTLPSPAEAHAELDEPDPVPAPVENSADEVDELEYASDEERRRVDELAMTRAMDEATRRWPTAAVTQMPHNNPGFDIEVQHPVEGTRYIEVKGTRSPEPAFFITAGEVEHSRRHPDRYSIWIFHAMDLDSGETTLTEHNGPVTESYFELQPVQYRGRFVGPGWPVPGDAQRRRRRRADARIRTVEVIPPAP